MRPEPLEEAAALQGALAARLREGASVGQVRSPEMQEPRAQQWPLEPGRERRARGSNQLERVG